MPAAICAALCACQSQVTPTTPSLDLENTEPERIGQPAYLSPIDTSPGWYQEGPKLRIEGVVRQIDGKTPAPGVVLYYYHTDTEGRYVHHLNQARSMPPNAQGQTHGYIRGWVKTDSLGRYAIHTVRPGAYPKGNDPAHIHVVVQEPAMPKGYYLDDFVFDDDPLLTSAKRKKMENRGGSGVLRLTRRGDTAIGERNIVLGLHIPDYPATQETSAQQSGRAIGEEVFSFIPYHAWGPDKGSKVCPICKYGPYPGLLFFAGEHPDWDNIAQWLAFFEAACQQNERLKVFFICPGGTGKAAQTTTQKLEAIGAALHLEKVALCWTPSYDDKDSEVDGYKIRATAGHTILFYQNRMIVDKWVGVLPTDTVLAQMRARFQPEINRMAH